MAWFDVLLTEDVSWTIRHELHLDTLEGVAAWTHLLAVQGVASISLLLGATVAAPLDAMTRGEAGESLRGVALLVLVGLLGFVLPSMSALAVLLAIHGAGMEASEGTYILGGLVATALTFTIPLGSLESRKRLHQGAGFWEVAGSLALPFFALAVYLLALREPCLMGNGLTVRGYEFVTQVAAFYPAWLFLMVMGGVQLLYGLALSPSSAVGFGGAVSYLVEKLK